jgi:N-acetyl-gamma-glutamyl-phosphate reductase
MVKVGIVGGAGYTAGELLRILLNHPQAEIKFVFSGSQKGKKLADVHTDLIGETDRYFDAQMHFDVDVIFLCRGHSESRKFLASSLVPEHIRIIDLSTDFRPGNPEHDQFTYGLTELKHEKIVPAQRVANPGCFATSILLALLPLAVQQRLPASIHVNAVTGSTGAGYTPTETTHFSWRNNNFSVYRPFQHQHMLEIAATLNELQPEPATKVHFLPYRGNFTRGIYSSVYGEIDGDEKELIKTYTDYYADSPFVHVTRTAPDLKMAVNSNKCILHIRRHENMVLITSIIDNLLKGASGQAVQNMNIMFGLPEDTGLRLKPVAF